MLKPSAVTRNLVLAVTAWSLMLAAAVIVSTAIGPRMLFAEVSGRYSLTTDTTGDRTHIKWSSGGRTLEVWARGDIEWTPARGEEPNTTDVTRRPVPTERQRIAQIAAAKTGGERV